MQVNLSLTNLMRFLRKVTFAWFIAGAWRGHLLLVLIISHLFIFRHGACHVIRVISSFIFSPLNVCLFTPDRFLYSFSSSFCTWVYVVSTWDGVFLLTAKIPAKRPRFHALTFISQNTTSDLDLFSQRACAHTFFPGTI